MDKKLLLVREQIQSDLMCYLDGIVSEEKQEKFFDDVCGIVVDNFKKLGDTNVLHC